MILDQSTHCLRQIEQLRLRGGHIFGVRTVTSTCQSVHHARSRSNGHSSSGITNVKAGSGLGNGYVDDILKEWGQLKLKPNFD